MLPSLFDSHTHLQFAAFDNDREEVVKKTLENNIWVVNVGSQKNTSQKAVDLALQYKEGVYATVGIHPIHTDTFYHDPEEIGGNGFNGKSESFDYNFYKELAEGTKVVAIGECGLDYYRIKAEQQKKKQEEIFIKHIELANELNKPLMIHCRNAFDDLICILNSNSQLLNTNPGIVHFFTGNFDNAKILLEMGFYFTFGGLITYNRDFDEIIKFLPLEKMLLETDAPYVAPEPHRARLPDGQGKRNEPIYIIETAKKLAEIKNISFQKIAKQTTQNAIEIFKIPVKS